MAGPSNSILNPLETQPLADDQDYVKFAVEGHRYGLVKFLINLNHLAKITDIKKI
jgi:hypothetical protein